MENSNPLIQTNQQNKKLKRGNSDVDSSDTEEEISVPIILNNWPRFMLIQSVDPERPISKLSPFTIHQGIKGLAGTPRTVRRLRSGDFLIEVTKPGQAESLLRSTVLADIPIKVVPHRSLNTSKGIIRSFDLRESSEAELKQNLANQGVTDVRRMTVMRDGQRRNTNTFVLTFGQPSHPTYVKCAYLNIKVETFIPNPLRCYKCQRFGHHKFNCRRNATCARCGEEGHEDSSCSQPEKCINCQDSHSAYSKICPIWKKEKQIQYLKVTNNISFPEARKLAETADSQASHSYASAVKQSAIDNNTKETNSVSTQTTSVSTQTELTWPLSSKLPTMIPLTNQKGAQAKTTVSSQTTPTTSDHNLNPGNIKTTTKPPQHHKNKTGSIIQPPQHHKDQTESITKLSQRDKDKPDSTKLPPNKPAIPKKNLNNFILTG